MNSPGSFELIKSVANYSKSQMISYITREWLDRIEKGIIIFCQIADHDLV